jgi:enamine deaminase RidA (YjgF/YER057c/UK114 family)
MGAHQTTAMELVEQLPGLTDVVCATGTGATAAGLRAFLPEHITVHSRASESGVIDGLSNIRRYDNFCDAGTLAGYDEGVFDADKSKDMQRQLLARHGLAVGPSTGATGYLAMEIKKKTQNPDAVVAFISACGLPVPCIASGYDLAPASRRHMVKRIPQQAGFGLASNRSFGTCASSARSRGVHTEASMAEKGIVLPVYQDAMWSYVKAQRDGNLLYIGDHVGQNEEAVTIRGKVGDSADGATVTPEEANKLAGQASLRLLSTVSHYLGGNLDNVDQVVKLTGIVNGVPDFQGHGKVVDGASDMLFECLGDRGKHARTCVGAGSCPAAVTVELIVRIKEGTSIIA